METININGKEYTENEFTRKCKKHKILLDGSLSMIFDELKEKFARQQPEPPTFRLMSDYGYRHQKVTYLLEGINGNRSWQEGMLIGGGIQLRQGGLFAESNDFKGIYGQIKGWFLALPNPDEIKLPC
jgi:hypothetical protein